MNHAFLIVAHRDPGQLYDILRLLQAPNHYFYINIDEKFENHKVVADIIAERIPNTEFTFMNVAHGGYSQIRCTLNLMRLAFDAEMDYYHLISGQDFPCKANKDFDNFFELNKNRSFMWFDTEEQHKEWIDNKYQIRTRGWYLYDLKYRKIKFINRFVNFVNSKSKNFLWRNKIEGLRAGWNWFSLHRQVVNYILNQLINQPSYFNRFKHTYCCDEIIFHTLLYPVLKELNINHCNSVRYVDWGGVGKSARKKPGSPLILNEEDFEHIIMSNALFCRKIDIIISMKLKTLLANRIIPGFKLTDETEFSKLWRTSTK